MGGRRRRAAASAQRSLPHSSPHTSGDRRPARSANLGAITWQGAQLQVGPSVQQERPKEMAPRKIAALSPGRGEEQAQQRVALGVIQVLQRRDEIHDAAHALNGCSTRGMGASAVRLRWVRRRTEEREARQLPPMVLDQSCAMIELERGRCGALCCVLKSPTSCARQLAFFSALLLAPCYTQNATLSTRSKHLLTINNATNHHAS